MIIKVKVRPNQKSFSVSKGLVWTVALKSSPENNQANRELVKELSRKYASVRIVSGFKSKFKTLEIGATKT